CYRTVAEINARLDALAAANPALMAIVDAGDSWERTQSSSGGEDLRVARITNSAVSGPKPALFVTTAIHPRELPTAETGLRFVERLLDGYGVDPDITWIVDHHEVHVLVLTNPDGRKRAETGLSWRKNTNNNFCANSNLRGIDLNRNLGFQWGGLGASTSPCDQTFRGPSAQSEPESQAIDAYQRLLFPDRRGPALTDPAPADTSGIYIDVHNNAAQVLWPYGIDETTVAPNDTALRTLGRRLAWLNGYEPLQINGLYPASGSTADNSYGELGVASYAIELGGEDFDASCTTFEADIAPGNVAALMYAARVVRAPYLLPSGPEVREATTSPPLAFAGDVVRVSAVADDARFSQAAGIEPTQPVASARAWVDALPWLPGSPSQPVAAVDGAFDATREAIAATIATDALAIGRHLVWLQARDASGADGPLSAAFVRIVDPATHGTLQGQVRNRAGVPLAAQVRAGSLATASDASGAYRHRLPQAAYDVTYSAPHHESETLANVAIAAGATSVRDVALYALCPYATQDAESGIGAWSVQTTAGTNTWAIAPATGAFASSHWTESVAGNYGNNANTSLVSPVLDLGGYTQPVLAFDIACDTESGWDYLRVEVRTGPSAPWSEAWSCSGTPDRRRVTVDLAPLAGATAAQLRFRFTSDTNTVRDGVRIDDVVLEAGGPTCRATQGAADAVFANGFE
ncbi:MAG TPA: M14 family zinc carboxypeptidase, partial [Xanthomonadales bacterium]|nr:M14 family zinc carboxypeptidase [Xanthomonadales bacterium]